MDDIFFVHSFQRLFSFVKIICMYLLVLDIYLNYTANEYNEDCAVWNYFTFVYYSNHHRKLNPKWWIWIIWMNILSCTNRHTSSLYIIGSTLRSELYSYIFSFSITYSTMVNIFSRHGESLTHNENYYSMKY